MKKKELRKEKIRTEIEKQRVKTYQTAQSAAEEQNKAMQAAITAEQTRSCLVQAKAENDEAEIERRQNLEKAGIDPDAPPPQKPKNWFGKHKFWIIFVLFWAVVIVISILYDKGVIR